MSEIRKASLCKDIIKENNLKFDDLEESHIWAYGVGHFLNDLCAAAWFNFLLIYLTAINPIFPNDPGMSSSYAGLLF